MRVHLHASSDFFHVLGFPNCFQAEWVMVGMNGELKGISSANSHSDWLSGHDAVPAAGVETCLIKKDSLNVLVLGPISFYFRHVFWCPGRSLHKRITLCSMMKQTKLTHSVAGMQHL